MTLRAENQQRLQNQILDAAALLIRRDGGVGFSMRKLADVAGVGLVTPYNLFGSKGAVLIALFDQAVDELEMQAARVRARTPVTRVIAVVRAVVELYTAEPEYYRPLLQALLASGEPIHRLFGRSLAAFSQALRGAEQDGTLIAGIDVGLVARQLVIVCTGVLELWVHEELDDAGCAAQMVYSAMLSLRAVVEDSQAQALAQQMRTMQPSVPAYLSGARADKPMRPPSSPSPRKRSGRS